MEKRKKIFFVLFVMFLLLAPTAAVAEQNYSCYSDVQLSGDANDFFMFYLNPTGSCEAVREVCVGADDYEAIDHDCLEQPSNVLICPRYNVEFVGGNRGESAQRAIYNFVPDSRCTLSEVIQCSLVEDYKAISVQCQYFYQD